jgi:hypothetical protein
MEMQKKAANRGRRERSPKQEYLVCELATRERRRAPYIGEQQAQVGEPGRHG